MRRDIALLVDVEAHVDPAKVRQLRVRLSQTVFDLHGKLAQYKAKFDALISAHYTAAIVLHDRKLTLAQFEPARYDDPVIRRSAAEQVDVQPDPALTGVQAVVEIEMADGKTLTARCEHPRGSAENPLTWGQIEGKLRTYADGVLAPAHVDEVVRMVSGLEEIKSVARLRDMLRASPRQAPAARVASVRG